MLSALQQVFGGSLNADAEILARDDGSVVQPNKKEPAITGLSYRLPISA
jgi:hypothetical protein